MDKARDKVLAEQFRFLKLIEMKTAVFEDVGKEYLKAVMSYESEIASDSSTVPADTYANLAFLYWSFAAEQMEFNVSNNIPDEWSIIGGDRYELILDKGIALYPNSMELCFWRRCFSFRLYGEEFREEDCLTLMNEYQGDTSLVPYFFLYRYDKLTYQTQRDNLIEICLELPTAKNLYIYSIIAS